MSAADLTIFEAGRALRAGDLSASDLLDAHLERTGWLGAFVHVSEARARAAAERADRDLAEGRDHGPLHGIPFAVKDLIDMAGEVTGCGSRVPRAAADADAPVIARLLAAGAVPLGKVATYEFALTGPSFDGPHPPPRNPWDADRVTGGSSSGSAAAVAGGLVRLALGTDTGGSVRSPACYCGCVGLKPSFGAVPMDGVFPLSPSLDHLGPLAASVAEAAALFDAMAGRTTRLDRIEAPRLAYARAWAADDPQAHPGVIGALDDAVSVLSLTGARIELVGMPDYALAEAAGAVILHAEALEVHRAGLRDRFGTYGRQARQSLAAGVAIGPQDVAMARRQANRAAAAIDALLADHDAIVTATTLTPAPPVAAFRGEQTAWTPMRTLPFNLTGHPALQVPMGLVDGMPVGLQIVGRMGDEATILRLGAAFEAATDHAAQRPRAAAT